MPLYEYQCDSCAHRFELIQKFSDPPAQECPSCRGSVHKLPSSPAIQFKGSGWYITDYARKGASGNGSGGDAGSTGGKAAADKSSPSSDKPSTSGSAASEPSGSTPKSS